MQQAPPSRSMQTGLSSRVREGLTGRGKPYVLLVVLALVWGLHWPISKVALRDVPPFTYGTLRAATGLAVVVAALIARRGLRLPARGDLPVVFSVGIGQMAAGIAIMNLALQVVAAGRSSILVYTMPLWVAAIQLPALRSRRDPWQLAGLLLGLAGIAMLLNPGAIDWGASGQLLGSAELLFSALIWAITTIHLRHHTWHGNPLDLEPWQLLVAVVPLALLTLLLEPGRPIHWEPVAIGAVLYSGVLATAVAFWLTQSISRSLSPLATTMGFLGVPIVGLASSWLLLGEPIGVFDVAGALATFAGIVIVSIAGGRVDVETPPDVAAATVRLDGGGRDVAV